MNVLILLKSLLVEHIFKTISAVQDGWLSDELNKAEKSK